MLSSSRLFSLAARLSSPIISTPAGVAHRLKLRGVVQCLFFVGSREELAAAGPAERLDNRGMVEVHLARKADAPFTDTCMWHELTVRERAASDMLGYDEASWDQEMLVGDDDDDDDDRAGNSSRPRTSSSLSTELDDERTDILWVLSNHARDGETVIYLDSP